MENTSNNSAQIILFLQQNRFALTVFCLLGVMFCLYSIFKNTHKPEDSLKRMSQWETIYKRLMFKLRKLYIRIMYYTTFIPILGDLVNNIKHGYKCHEALTDDEATIRAGRTLFLTAVSFTISFIFGLLWFKDILISVITSFIIGHIAMTSLKSNTCKFLTNLIDAIEDFLLAYHKSSGNIDDAFFAVRKTRNPMSKHFDIIYDYIKKAYTSTNPEMVQSEYNNIAPSRFLRNFYAIVFMAYKYGDQKEDGKSLLNINLMELQEQIGDARYQQNKLQADTMGLRWFIIGPVYAIPLLSDYMLEYFSFEGFEYVESFITSSTGYMAEVLCTVCTLICYLLYAQMVDRRILEVKQREMWEKKVLRNPHIRKIIMKLLPDNSPKRKKIHETITKAGSTDTVNALQIQRVFLAFFMGIIAIISISLNVVTNTITIGNDIYTGLPKDNYTKILMTQDDAYTYIDEMLAADKIVIEKFRNDITYLQSDEETQLNTINQYLRNEEVGKAYRGYSEYGAQRIQSKINHLQKVGGLNNGLFIIILILFGYYIPLILMKIRAYMNKDMIILDEVTDLQKMTIMLMGYSSTTPDGLLTWYSSSAMMLAPQLRECRVTKDFNKLINSNSYKPFVQLTSSLEMAFNGLTMKEAFSGVEQRLLTQKKEQNRIIERLLKFRADTVATLTSISMYAVIGIYMILPLIVSMVQMFFSLNIF